MIRRSLFRKNYVIFASIILFFIVISISASWILTSFERDRMFMRPASINRSLLLSFDADPFKALVKLNSFARENFMEENDLIDASGVSLISQKQILSQALTQEQIAKIVKENYIQWNHNMRPGPPQVVSSTQKPGVYLYSMFGPHGDRPPVGPLVTLASLIACILISIGVALFYQFSKYQVRANEAVAVLNSLREGNLSSRLPIVKFDELSPLTKAFNQMADDIEAMVEQLRKSDQSRRYLLQDLAHDLRTPMTSLRTFVETMQMAGERLTEEKRQEVLALCSSEIEYFSKLVEDLLFLAQITEPKYSSGSERLNLAEKISDQLPVFKARYPNLKYHLRVDTPDASLIGSEKLLNRLLRNAFENSSSFARGEVRIHVSASSENTEISFVDDGPGFSAKALQEFGHKKVSRVVWEEAEGKRISVGIGSVIMREIAQLHAGRLQAENVVVDDQIRGARVSFSFKRS